MLKLFLMQIKLIFLYVINFIIIYKNNFRRTRAWNIIQPYKEETPAQFFSCEFCEFLRILFLQNTSGQLFLKSLISGKFKIRSIQMSFFWSMLS